MKRSSIFLLLLSLPVFTLNANEQEKFSDEEFRLVNQSAMDFNLCVQENAGQYLQSYDDVREAAAQTVSHCENHFEELKTALGSKSESDYYKGVERHIKNRTIKKLLPMMMFQKSAHQNTSTESN